VKPLTAAERELLDTARHAVLATIAPDGVPRLVPIAFVFVAAEGVIYSALDEKRKTVTDPRDLARVRDIGRDPRVAILIHRWSEDWMELGWLRLSGDARLISADSAYAAEHLRAVSLLRLKYAQYAGHRLENRPIIRIVVLRATSWAAS
jgi:PPOX class probable F420-dependent enzyme